MIPPGFTDRDALSLLLLGGIGGILLAGLDVGSLGEVAGGASILFLAWSLGRWAGRG